MSSGVTENGTCFLSEYDVRNHFRRKNENICPSMLCDTFLPSEEAPKIGLQASDW